MIEIHALFLDDNKNRHMRFREVNTDLRRIHVYDADSCIEELLDVEKDFDIIYLDHDLNAETNNQLNDDEKDGRYVCKRMTKDDIKSRYSGTLVVIHSLNSVGAKEMSYILRDAGYEHIVIAPFAWESHGRSKLQHWI